MFGSRWRLVRFFGIPISVDPSWLVILALLTWTMAGMYQNPPPTLAELYPVAGLGLTPGGYLVMGLASALAFFVCILLHEMGHALAARSLGMRIRGITLFLFGGVAELEGEPPSAGIEFVMAIAGPLVSLVLALGFGALSWLGDNAGWTPVAVVVSAYLASINMTVLLFNLVPAFPLDGGRVLRAFLWAVTGRLRKATRWASACGQAFAWLLIFLGVLQFFHGNVFGGIWLGLVGMFVNNAARGSYQQVLIRQTLEGEPVRRFMTTQLITVPPALDLRALVEDYVYRYHRKAFPVVSGDRLAGVVSTEAVAQVPRHEWDFHTVGEVMECDLRAVSIPADADGLEVLARMQRTGRSRLLVVDGDRLAGIVSLRDVLRFLQLKLELETEEPGRPSPVAPPHFLSRREVPHSSTTESSRNDAL